MRTVKQNIFQYLRPTVYLLALASVFLLLVSSIHVSMPFLDNDIIDSNYDPRPKDMEMHLRRLRMHQTCKKYGSVLKAPDLLGKKNTLIWDLRDKLIYCRIAKVASSTWTTNLLRLDPEFNKDLPESQRWAKEFGARENEAFRLYPVPKSERKRSEALEHSTKFLVVRHPLDRLVSSYLDKVADTSKEPNLLKHRDVKNKILGRANKTSSVTTVPTFSEFIDYVLEETEGRASPADWKGVMTWKSYAAKCLPCDVKYDVIMKLETHAEDEKWLINTRNLTLISKTRDWRHLSSSSSTRSNLISQLTQAQLDGIYKNYLIDFEMFSYTMEQYAGLVRP